MSEDMNTVKDSSKELAGCASWGQGSQPLSFMSADHWSRGHMSPQAAEVRNE